MLALPSSAQKLRHICSFRGLDNLNNSTSAPISCYNSSTNFVVPDISNANFWLVLRGGTNDEDPGREGLNRVPSRSRRASAGQAGEDTWRHQRVDRSR